ncbi:hypothetical protein [Pleionea sp. CnH1-48]|nr:hypothetical protein [Pleionea sp. CnH1-48]
MSGKKEQAASKGIANKVVLFYSNIDYIGDYSSFINHNAWDFYGS